MSPRKSGPVAGRSDWLPAGLLLALCLAVCLALGVAAAHEITAKELLLSSIPSWLQGIGTIAAALLAWIAYLNWRGQEAAKRKAAAAERILMAAFQMTSAVRDGRMISPLLVGHAQDEEAVKAVAAIVSSPERVRLVELSGEPAAVLQSFQLLAAIYFGAEARAIMAELVDQREMVSKAMINVVSSSKQKDAFDEFLFGLDPLVSELATLGAHADAREINEARQDALDLGLEAMVAKLAVLLEPFVTYQATS